jgi:hypothetical protein
LGEEVRTEVVEMVVELLTSWVIVVEELVPKDVESLGVKVAKTTSEPTVNEFVE